MKPGSSTTVVAAKNLADMMNVNYNTRLATIINTE
jgi:hypothetical protein